MIILRNLHLSGANVDFAIYRSGGSISLKVRHNTDHIELSIVQG